MNGIRKTQRLPSAAGSALGTKMSLLPALGSGGDGSSAEDGGTRKIFLKYFREHLARRALICYIRSVLDRHLWLIDSNAVHERHVANQGFLSRMHNIHESNLHIHIHH